MVTILSRGTMLCGLVLLSQPAHAAAEGGAPTAYCQGFSTTDGRMLVSKVFPTQEAQRAEAGRLPSSVETDFAREAKRASGATLIDVACYTGASEEETAALAEASSKANAADWKIETLNWVPKSARQPAAAAGARAATGAVESGGRSEAALAAEKAAAEATAAAREANENQLRLARQQTEAIEAGKRANEERIRKYNEQMQAFQAEQAAYQQRRAAYEQETQASEAARLQWAADVAACKAGDRSRCGSK